MTMFKNCNAFLSSSMLQTCQLVTKYFGHFLVNLIVRLINPFPAAFYFNLSWYHAIYIVKFLIYHCISLWL